MLIFILLSLLLFCSCATPQVQEEQNNDFYLGLLVSDNNERKIQLFENALKSSNMYVRQAAAGELAVLMSQGTDLSAETINLLRREASGWWAAAFDVTQRPIKEKALSFLLSFEQNASSPFDEARHYVQKELERQQMSFTEREIAAIEAHHAVSHFRYSNALNHFRVFHVNGNWPAQIPSLFIEYPNLINDLGRTFQNTQAASEGYNLFLQWEANLQRSGTDDLRYRLLFYAARISARPMGQTAQAIALYERALPLAPDYEQQDACIWNILDLSMGGPINVIMNRLERLVPLWHSGSYFNSMMERYLHRLVTASDWERVIRTYDLIKNINIGLKAGYSWVIARAIEEGYLSSEEMRLAAVAANVQTATAAVFMRIAYNSVDNLLVPAIYYRMQSADALNLPFINIINHVDNFRPTPAVQFLLGFFENDAEAFANPYIRSLERNLSPDELRAVAQALDQAHMHPQSMRVVGLYINRDGYVRNRRDLELMYPRPYLELIETNAKNFGIDPPLFFGLIRSESAFQHAVGSHAGAVGLAQLMPVTARDQAELIRRRGGPDFFGPDGTIDRTDPDLNVYIGAFYYNSLMNRFNDHQLALMSYNGGQTRVNRWFLATRLPVDLFVETVTIYETRDYGKRVPAIGRIYEELYYK